MIAILTAMPEELEAISAAIDMPRVETAAGRRVIRGSIAGEPVAAAFSRWGKVAAAATASHLLTALRPSCVVFTGIAGALRDELAVGDFVFARNLYQHDLDASPFFPVSHVPLLDRAALPADPELTAALRAALETHLQAGPFAQGPTDAHRPSPRTWLGDIATGDQVIGTRSARARVVSAVPEASCVEMEGAAVAQVCFEFQVPFACVRMISDRADESLAPDEVFRLARRSGEHMASMLRNWLQGRGA
jgi:adenosylhomocysteine nucleosidase